MRFFAKVYKNHVLLLCNINNICDLLKKMIEMLEIL